MKDAYTHRWDWIIALVKENGYAVGAEVGVFQGRNLFNILNACPKLFMYAVDQWIPVEGGVKQNTYRNNIGAHSISLGVMRVQNTINRQYKGRAQVLHGPSIEMAKRIEDEALDFIFIDADHRYEFVIEDLKAWYPKIKYGGTISGHDHGDPRFPGVERAVKECFGNNYGTTKVHGIWFRRKEEGAWLL